MDRKRYLTSEFSALGLLILGVPFGVAFQNFVMVILGGLFLWWYGPGLFNVAGRLSDYEKRSMIWASFFVAMTALATSLNLKVPNQSVISYIVSHGVCFGFPVLFMAVKPQGTEQKEVLKDRLSKGAAFLGVLMLLCFISQGMIGWRLEGIHIQFDHAYTRARGFFSHPLTLAYVALALLPLSLILTKYHWRKPYPWLILMAVLGAIYFSMSRTVQALTMVIFVWNILTLKERKVRYAALGVMLLSILAILGTDNLVSHRLKNMIRGGGTQWSEDTYSHYPDDRLAFWDIHLQMIKERPLRGHGVAMNQEYRRPYYEAMGLKDFKKPYEAHNQLIQIVAEGGLAALVFFCLWIYYLFRSFADQGPIVAEVRNQTLVLFILGGMTQNAYHDSEVRYALMVILALGFVSKELCKHPEDLGQRSAAEG